MAFFPPIVLIRKKLILKKLSECNAFSEQTAITLKDAGVFNPNAFARVNQKLVNDNVLKRLKGDKYYIL